MNNFMLSPRRSALLLLAVWAGLVCSFAQTAFQRTYSCTSTSWDYAYSVQQTSDGGYILAGQSSDSGTLKAYFIKTNAGGDTLWTRTYDARDVQSVKQTADGGYIATGNSSTKDLYILKLGPSGSLVWMRTYGGPRDDRGRSVLQTADTGFIVAGYTLDESDYNKTDAYLVRTNAAGDSLWTKTYASPKFSDARSVDVNPDGGYVLAGSIADSYFSRSAAYLIRTNLSGNVLWTKTYSSPSQESGADDFGRSVCRTSDGGYIIAGDASSSGVSYLDLCLVKTDSMGTVLWRRTYGGPFDEFGYAVRQTLDGGYIVAGSSYSFHTGNSDVYLIKTDPSGDTLWTRVYGGDGSDAGYSVQQASDGGYVIAGKTTTRGTIQAAAWLIKTRADGRLVSVPDDRNLFLPAEVTLQQNFPNPFNPSTTIGYALPHRSHVRLTVFTTLGQTVAEPVNGDIDAGYHAVQLNGSDLASGVYFYRLQAGAFVKTKAMLLLR